MKLQSRIILMLLPVLIAYGCFDYFIQRTVIMPSFLALEKDQAGKDLQRCVEALQRELHHLGQFTNDWAAWDDSYRFIHERNPEYVASNLGVQTFIDNRLNAIFYIDHTGRIVWGETHDSVSGTLQHCPEITDQFIPRLHQLLPTDEKGGSLKGILLTEADPLLIAVRPILASDHSGPTRGHLIMGRFLNADLIKHLNDQTGVTHQVKPVADDLLPLSAVGPDGSTRLNGSFHMEGDESHLSVSTIIEDIYGTPALVVEARLAREIFARGLSTVNTSRVSDLAAGIVLLLVLIVLLRWIVLHPLAHLTRHAIKLRQSADLTLRCDFKRSDEIGLLSHEFDLLVGELQKSRANLEAMVLKRTAALRQANT